MPLLRATSKNIFGSYVVEEEEETLMPYHDPKEIVPDDFKSLRSWSLEEVDGVPVLHMSMELHQHREYDPEPTSLFLPSIDPRRLMAPEPVDPVAEQTDKQEAVMVDAPVAPPADDAKPANGKKSKSSSDTSQDSTPAGETAPAVQTGQGG